MGVVSSVLPGQNEPAGQFAQVVPLRYVFAEQVDCREAEVKEMRRMRLLPVSLTKTPPEASTAMPWVALKEDAWPQPLALPRKGPHTPAQVTTACVVVLICRTQLLPVSATYTFPAESLAKADG